MFDEVVDDGAAEGREVGRATGGDDMRVGDDGEIHPSGTGIDEVILEPLRWDSELGENHREGYPFSIYPARGSRQARAGCQ